MKIFIDTSSLISLHRYYIPFDKEKILREFINNQIKSKEIIIIKEVYTELGYILKKEGEENLFLSEKKLSTNTTYPPNKKTLNKLENNWVIPLQKKKLKDDEWGTKKTKYMESADFKLIEACLQPDNRDNQLIITEETDKNNDMKLFKKIPSICKLEALTCNNLRYLLFEYYEKSLSFTIQLNL